MKRYSLLFGVLFVFTAVQAQFTDFGANFSFQKGDFAVGDIDNDGDLDIIFSGDDGGPENGAIMINNGSGQFTKQEGERIIKIGLGGNIQFGDIDGDGDLDVIFAGYGNNGAKGIALNDGNGIYTLADKTKYPINTAAKVTSCGFADFNMDGLLDYYFFANYTKSGDQIVNNCIIYYQQHDGTFLPSTDAFPTLRLNEAQVSVVDFDNDGCPDIFINAGNEGVANPDTDNQRFSYLFKNDGYGNFEGIYAGVNLTYMKSNGTSSWGDFNGDGYLDLLHNGDGYLNSGEQNDRMWRIYKNKAGSAVEEVYSGALGRQNGVGNGSIIVDWNNDGKLDFIAGGYEGTKQITDLRLGDDPAKFTFTRSDLADTTFPGISEQSFRVADLDGDNKVDLLIAGYSGGTLNLKRRIAGWVKNQSTKASTLPNAPTNLKEVVDNSDGLMVTFSWDAPVSENGKYGTSYNLALKNKTTGKWLYNPMAVIGGDKDGWRKVGGRIGNVYLNKEFYLYDLPAGEYEWTVQAINGAYLGGKFATPKTFTIQTTGINSVNTKGEAEVNVFNKTIIVKDKSEVEKTLKVYSVGGALLKSMSFVNEATVNLQDAGIYIVELQRANGTSYKTKISIE